MQQVGIQKGLLLGSDGSLVLQVKVTFSGEKNWENRRRVRENWEEQCWGVPGECFPLEFSAVQQVVMVRTRFWPYFSLLVCNFNQALLILSVDCFS